LAVLRITPVHDCRGLALKVEGKLSGPWTDELRRFCAEVADQRCRPRLDLSAVSFIDASGAELLAELRDRGFSLEGCTGFVTAVLRAEKQ
jgi:anti-anti-sigma regulatory factor